MPTATLRLDMLSLTIQYSSESLSAVSDDAKSELSNGASGRFCYVLLDPAASRRYFKDAGRQRPMSVAPTKRAGEQEGSYGHMGVYFSRKTGRPLTNEL